MKIDELRTLIRELIKSTLSETSSTGVGSFTSTGNSEAYSTPYAFKKKNKK